MLKVSRQPSPETYGRLTHRPLTCFAFVLPLLLFFHISLIWVKADMLLVEHDLDIVLRFFGAAGPYLPALAMTLVLLGQHLLCRYAWRPRLSLLPMMWLEALLWTLPMVAMSYLIAHLAAARYAGPGLFGDVVVSVGASIYEEFLFRLVLIGLAMLIFVDIFEWPKRPVALVAVLATAAAFSLYHPQVWQDEAVLSGRLLWGPFGFRTLAGIYLGGLFLVRGFGIVVGAHALYNVYAALRSV